MAGGILAIAAGIGGNEVQVQMERQAAVAEFKQPMMTEYQKRATGEEMKSLRTENSQSFKGPRNEKGQPTFQGKIYSKQVYWKDADTDTLRPLDLTVREVSTLAALNPLRTHDKYVDAGPYTAQWLNDRPHDYRMEIGDSYVMYQALFDDPGITVVTEPTESGMKETVTITSFEKPGEKGDVYNLQWCVSTRGTLVPQADNSYLVRMQDGSAPLRISAPVASDASGKPVMAVASVSGDTLTFRVTVLPGQEYPVTVDPTTTVNVITATSGYVIKSGEDTYSNIRNAVTGTGAGFESTMYIGQNISGSLRLVSRTFISIPLSDLGVCDACTLYIDGARDGSVTDFNVNIYGARLYKSTLTATDFSHFNGWQSSGAYNGVILNDAWSSSSYSADWNKLVFNAAGKDSVQEAFGDTLWVALLSSCDVSATEMSNEEDMEITRTGGNAPYLSITYHIPAINPPTNFLMTPITGARDSLLLTWTKNYSDNIDSLVLYQWPDSARIATLTKTASSARIGGLNPYTHYRWYVRADSAAVYGYSNPDSMWTCQTFKTENLSLLLNGYTGNNVTAVYDSARGEIKADSLTQGDGLIGQWKDLSNAGGGGANMMYIHREYMTFALPAMKKVQAESLMIAGASDSSATDFSIVARSGFWNGGTAADEKYYSFDGWQSQMTAYTGSALTSSYSTAGFTTGATLNKIPFTQAGRDTTIKRYGAGDSLKVLLLSSNDISATAPTKGEYVTITAGSSYLKLTYAPPDTAAGSVTITAISTDSLLVSWTDRSYSERGFIVVNSVGGTIVAGTDTTNQDVTSKRIGGLLPNTSYTWKVKAVGGGADGLLSAADSCYTKAKTLNKPTVTMVTDSTRKIVFDTTGIYTSFTRIAAQDSITRKFIDYIDGIHDTLSATMDSSNADYRTYANWNGSSGTIFKYEVGKTSAMRAWTKSAQ